jgi:hypothetical protein
VLTPVSLSFVQTVVGVSQQQWNADSKAQLIFRTAVATSLGVSTVSYKNVTILSIGSSRRLTESTTEEFMSRFLQSTNSVQVSYTIKVFAQLVGYTTAAAAGNALTNTLTTAVTSNAFTSTLQSTANAYQDTTLASCTSNSITALSTTSSPTTSSPDLVTQYLPAIIIVPIVVVAIASFLIYYLVRQRRQKNIEASATPPTDSSKEVVATPIVKSHEVEIN